MSDFITHLLNRHLGKDEMARPRARARFEPDTLAAFLPHDIEEESQRPTSTVPGVNSLANVPAANTITKAVDDSNTARQPIRIHQQPESVIQSIEAAAPVYPSFPGPAAGSEVNDKNKVLPDEHDAAGHPPQEFVRQERTGKSSLPLLEESDYLKPGNPGNSIHIVTVKTQEDSLNQQSRQRHPAAELSPAMVFPANLKAPEPGTTKSPPVFTAIPDTGTEVEGLLEAPAWLPGKQKEIHKRLLPEDSKVEPELVVNVSIGRIEVRANQSPPPQQARQQKKPSGVMTLDKYLSMQKQTQGGKL